MEKTSKKSSPRLQLVIAVMIMTALFLAELYVMINESNNIILVVGIAVLILIALYFVIDAIMDCMNEKNIANRELYDDIHRSEKASYMLLKKNLEEISKQVKALNGGSDRKEADSAEIIKAQKAIAKVTMSKSKETQDRLFIELNNLEASLKDSIHGLSEKLSGFQEEIERLAEHIARINEEAILAASKNSQEIPTIVTEAPVTFDEAVEDVVEDVVEESLEEVSLEEILAETEIGDMGESVDELDFGSLDLDELDLDVSSPAEEEDDVLSQLLAAEEATPAPVPAPAPADNGGKMNQDDIAALIASMTN
ncbi:MAG: hypothetical protein IJZ23_02660 [Roseburia sp.]|nr:hypothetical protein [Roseburia sp.]